MAQKFLAIFLSLSLLSSVVSTASDACAANDNKCLAVGGLGDVTSLLQSSSSVKKPVQPHKAIESKAKQAPSEKDAPDELSSKGEGGDDEVLVDLGNETRSTSNNFCINSKYIRNGAGDYYTRGNSNKAALGSYGNFQDCWTCSGTMDFKAQAPSEWVTPPEAKVMLETTVTLSSSQTATFEASGQVTAAKAAGAQANAQMNSNSASSAGFKASIISFQEKEALLTQINKNGQVLRNLAKYDSPRIVGGIIRLETAGDFSDAGCLEAGALASAGNEAASGQVSAKAKSCESMVLSFSPGTVIGFKLLKPTWGTGNDKNKIVNLETDHPCGYYDPRCGCNIFTSSR